MNTIVGAINFGGIVNIPQDYIRKKLGLNKITTGWQFLRSKYAKTFGFGIEVRGSAPDFESTEVIHERAMEAVGLALKHYGDMLIEADVQVKEGALASENELVTGYNIDFTLNWDFSKPVLIEITYDREGRSFRIMGVVFNHLIDGVPLALYLYLIHNHLVLGNASFLKQCHRVFSVPYSLNPGYAGIMPGKSGWLKLNSFNESHLFPVGSQIDVTDSNVLKLRKKMTQDLGQEVSSSSVELALLSMEMGTTWATDYIAQGQLNSERRVDVQSGYNGLGIVRTQYIDELRKAEPRMQYRWICNLLKDTTNEIKLERVGKGSASKFYTRYRRIPDYMVNLFDRRINYNSVMSVAGTQLIGSNLNGIDYGVPLFVGGIGPDDIRFIFIPSHGEHNNKTREERAKRSLETQVTEVSFTCGPKIRESSGRSVVYKSLKISGKKAYNILLDWGYAPEQIMFLTHSERVRQVFIEAYRPDSPMQGRIEKRAALYLDMPSRGYVDREINEGKRIGDIRR